MEKKYTTYLLIFKYSVFIPFIGFEKSQNQFISKNKLKTDYPCDHKFWFWCILFLHHLSIYEKDSLKRVECHFKDQSEHSENYRMAKFENFGMNH